MKYKTEVHVLEVIGKFVNNNIIDDPKDVEHMFKWLQKEYPDMRLCDANLVTDVAIQLKVIQGEQSDDLVCEFGRP